MTFSRRIALASAAAVAIAVVLASALVYLLTSNQLHRQIDAQLHSRGRDTSRLLVVLREISRKGTVPAVTVAGPIALGVLSSDSPSDEKLLREAIARASTRSNPFGRVPPSPNQVLGYQQVVDAHGAVIVRSASTTTLPVDARTRHLAQHGGPEVFSDARVGGVHLRILAEALAPDRAVQFAQPLTELDGLLSRLRLILGLVCLGGVALAALLGRLVAGTAVLPLKRLTRATEHVAETRDLSGRLRLGGDDELGRLASSFNAMLDALERSMTALDASVHAQRQLVADASHELRTPVTSVRTNIEILQSQGHMASEERGALLTDVVEQIEELSLLVNDLIDLARGEEPRGDAEELRLDLLIEEVIDRARKRAPSIPVHTDLEPTIVSGVPERLARAVSNLIDNAVKHSPPGAAVEVALSGNELTVLDHGPGIPPEDLPHVFDRFYRGADARARPGSGLGLAIVRQVAHQQGGSVSAERAPRAGTLMRLRLPGAEPARTGVDLAREPASL